MKIKLTTLTLATVAMTGMAQAFQNTTDAPAKPAAKPAVAKLGLGSTAPALKGITWVQGDEVKSLDEKGKLYIIECWATWCGPCVQIIPHVNHLHNKYANKGLVIIGMNVFEEGVDKAQAFVKAQGAKMKYRVAYSGGEKGDFASSWLMASGTEGIPTAFVVRDGKIIYLGHPGALTDAKIESMMAADLDVTTFIKNELEAKAIEEKARAHEQKFMAKANELYQKQDWKGLKAHAANDSYAKNKPIAASIISQSNSQLGDWDGQSQLIKDIVTGNYGKDAKATQLVGMGLTTVESNDKVVAVAKTLAEIYAKEAAPQEGDLFGHIIKARVLFLAGQKEESIKILESTLKATDKIKNERGAGPFIEKIAASLKAAKAGTFPPFK